jgi:ubiquinone/menaquinone biosynthesis C-methylase UbiE
MLAVAKEKGFPANVAFIEADMENSNLADEQFDRVILNAVFPHFTNKIKALSEAVRVLKPGGSLTISHPIGREAVNNLHRQAGGVVAEDKVPTASLMQQLLKEVGLARVRVIDEPDFYLVIGYRPERY